MMHASLQLNLLVGLGQGVPGPAAQQDMQGRAWVMPSRQQLCNHVCLTCTYTPAWQEGHLVRNLAALCPSMCFVYWCCGVLPLRAERGG